MSDSILIATGNAHKVDEFRQILPAQTFESLKEAGLNIEIVEDGNTFAANAAKKALTVAKATGRLTIADDSGLEVDALDGKPGVYSARFAGENATDEENNAKLLGLLENITERGAQFACAICIADANGVLFESKGVCRGSLLSQRQGDGGFGYDPLFVPDGYTDSFATLGEAIKNKLSHRGKALVAVKDYFEKGK